MNKNPAVIFTIFVYALIGGYCSYTLTMFLSQIADLHPLIEFPLLIAILVVLFILHIYIHELGHLIAGLLSGYSFVSYRVFSWILIKQNGKLVWKRQYLPGLVGQCLLEPDDDMENMPVYLCNLGGILANIITGILCYGICFILNDDSLIIPLLKAFGFIGFMLALLNGFVIKGLANDGYYVYEMYKNELNKKAFLSQLKVNAYQVQGIRLKNMSESLFFPTTKEDRQYKMLSATAVFRANCMMDAHQFEEAYAYMEQLLKEENALEDIYRALLKMDCAFCEMLGQCRKEIVDAYLDKTTQQIMQAMKYSLAVFRIQYAYALLIEKDEMKAAERLKSFKEALSHTPFLSEIEAEEEFIAEVENQMHELKSKSTYSFYNLKF